MSKSINEENLKEQLAGTIVDSINSQRITDEILQQTLQNENFARAMDEMGKVREFVGSPSKILGSKLTKHGEIAEQVEVGVHRAKQALNSEEITATFEGVGRTAPEDYLIDGVAVQSKYINGTNNNLSSVLEHMDKYENFGRDGSYYHIPKDDYEIIRKIRTNEHVEGLSQRSINSIKSKITKIEDTSGKSFEEVVKPGTSEYAEVQQGNIHKTLNKRENELRKENASKKQSISDSHQASFKEGVKAAGQAAAVGATISLCTSLYEKHKEGKRFYAGDFTIEDWKDVGIETAKGGAVGAISGGAIYVLTNYASMSAPFAGAIVAATKGISELIVDLNEGKINEQEFMELGLVVCSESAIVGITTAVGQALIPIPVVGAMIGSIAGSILINCLGPYNKKTARMIRDEMNEFISRLDESYQQLVRSIELEFKQLGDLTQAAFNVENNTKLLGLSIELAQNYGVAENKIIKSFDQLDEYMLG